MSLKKVPWFFTWKLRKSTISRPKRIPRLYSKALSRGFRVRGDNLTRPSSFRLGLCTRSCPHAGHGTLIVIVQLDLHGHVTNAIIRESRGEALDKAAMEAAKQWEFTPIMVRGKVVPGAVSIRFEF